MSVRTTRREFLARVGAAAGTALAAEPLMVALGQPAEPATRVVIARDEALTTGRVDEHRDLLLKLLGTAMQKLTGARDGATAWRAVLRPGCSGSCRTTR